MSKKPKRSWLRFSLSTLLIVMVIAAVFTGWYGNEYNQKRRAIAWLSNRGGVTKWIDSGEPVPAWATFLKLDHRDVSHAGLVNCDETERLLPMKELTHIQLRHCSGDMSWVQGMPNLEHLTVLNDSITTLTDFHNTKMEMLMLLVGDEIPEEEIRKLRSAIPNCKLWVSSGNYEDRRQAVRKTRQFLSDRVIIVE